MSPKINQVKKLFKEMAELDHPYIFRQIHDGDALDAVFAVYTYALDQSLFVHLRQHRRLPELVACMFGAEIASALNYLHGLGRTFNNLGPEMVFLDEDGMFLCFLCFCVF